MVVLMVFLSSLDEWDTERSDQTMTTIESKSRQQRVQDALRDLLDADEHDNTYRYFRASDVIDIDPELSPAMVGSYLPRIEAESPLPSGLAIERYTERRCGASLWIVKRDRA
jgi:hypothetical protein